MVKILKRLLLVISWLLFVVISIITFVLIPITWILTGHNGMTFVIVIFGEHIFPLFKQDD